MSTMTLLALHVGTPQTFGYEGAADPLDRPWTTGFFKHPISGPVHLGLTNLAGDGQADLLNHGGPDKAVNVYPAEHYPYWHTLLPTQNCNFGGFGENFTTQGMLESNLCIGDIFEIGDAIVQVSQPRQPCWKLARRWRIKDLALQVQETGRTGWYFRVLREGTIQPGMQLVLIDRPCPEWTVARANDVMHHSTQDMEAARSLMGCAALSSRWRESLAKRISTGIVGNSTARLYGLNL